MVLTAKQEEGLRVAVQRYKERKPYTCISGYAGTGKSTLIKFIIAELDVNPETEVCYVAFTGKAATVLQSKGCANAITAHKLLYQAKPMPNGTYKFIPKVDLGNYKVIVVDEISMLPCKMWDLLLSHHVYVLATGDPGQLPPVDKDADNHVLDEPHVFLDEIMRQAQDSEIIRLSMWVREGKPLADFPCAGEQVRILTPDQVVSGVYEWPDQILCATNAKRNAINALMRQNRGFGQEPCEGDKIISLRNHWEYFSSSGNWALTNGSIGTITSFNKEEIYPPFYIYDKPITYMFTNIELEDGDTFIGTPIDYKGLMTGTPTLDGKQTFQLNKHKSSLDAPFDFAYAYAITCHKAQGSEWDKVLVFEEGFPYSAEEHRRWLYTAVTRAREKLVLVRGA